MLEYWQRLRVRSRLPLIASVVLLALTLQGCRKPPQEREAAFLKRGEGLVAVKQYSRAILEFRNAIRVMPKDAEPYYQLGIACMDAGDIFDAFRAFHRATELNPKHSLAQKKVAELLDMTQKSDLLQDAATRLKGVLRTSPDDEEATGALAVTELQMGKSEDATRRLEESLRVFPSRLKSSVALARIQLIENDLTAAEETLRKAVASAPDSSAARLALGQLYLVLKRPEKAEPEIEGALHLDPKNSSALLSLALLQIQEKRMDEAEGTLKRLSVLPGKPYRDLHAMFLYELGARDASVAELEALLRDDPDNRLTRGRLVLVYLDLHRTRDAQKLLAAALKRNPRDADALFQRGDLSLKIGKPRDAEVDLKEILRIQPDSAPCHFALARVYAAERLGNSEQAELNKALRVDPSLLEARIALAKSLVLENQPQVALSVLDEAPAAQNSEVSLIVSRNWALLQAGKLNELRSVLDKALRVSRVPELVLQDGLFRMEEKDYDGARADAEELLKLKPEDGRGARLLADTYLARNEAPKATQRLAAIAASSPKTASLQFVMGQWYMKNGHLAEARKALEAALAGDPDLTPAAINLAEIDDREHRVGPARQRLQAVLAKQPRNVYALLLLAGVDVEAGDRPGEIAAYRSVIGVDSSNAFALNNLAYALAPDDPDEALELAKRAVGLAPDNAAEQDTLGWIYYRKRMYTAAVDHLKAAVDRDPNPRRQFHLAMSYVKSGHPESGRDLLRNALKQDPNLATTEHGW